MIKKNQWSEQILIFIIQADGFTLDWQDSTEDPGPQPAQAQHAMYDAFRVNPDQALKEVHHEDNLAWPFMF